MEVDFLKTRCWLLFYKLNKKKHIKQQLQKKLVYSTEN